MDIYNAATDTWSTASLSQGRHGLAATTVGTKAIFAGGYGFSNSTGSFTLSAVVDTYDAATDTWSTTMLSEARRLLAATSVGRKALFAGGYNNVVNRYHSDRVDIYDDSTGTWRTASLSQARYSLAATTVGNKALFAGGSPTTAVVDIAELIPSGSVPSQPAKLTARDAEDHDQFGYSVALSGDTAVVGTPYDDDAGDGSGAAYVFVHSGNTWTEISHIKPD